MPCSCQVSKSTLCSIRSYGRVKKYNDFGINDEIWRSSQDGTGDEIKNSKNELSILYQIKCKERWGKFLIGVDVYLESELSMYLTVVEAIEKICNKTPGGVLVILPSTDWIT